MGAYELLCGSLLRLLGQPIEKFNKYKRDAHVRLHALIGPTGPYGQLPADDPRAAAPQWPFVLDAVVDLAAKLLYAAVIVDAHGA